MRSWTDAALDRDYWIVLVKAVAKFQIPQAIQLDSSLFLFFYNLLERAHQRIHYILYTIHFLNMILSVTYIIKLRRLGWA